MNRPFKPFRSKVEAFQRRMPVYWCLQCDRPAGLPKGKAMHCSNCGSKAHYFPSTGEHRRYAHLRMLEACGEITGLKLQPTFPVEIHGQRLCVYRGDFEYVDRNGRRVIEDYKASRDHTDDASALRRRAAELTYAINVTLVEA